MFQPAHPLESNIVGFTYLYTAEQAVNGQILLALQARKISEQKTIGRGKKIQGEHILIRRKRVGGFCSVLLVLPVLSLSVEPAQHYSSQIATLKANNTSLATALGELHAICNTQ